MTHLVAVERPIDSNGLPTDPDNLRRAFWANALSIDGMHAGELRHRSTWLELLGPSNSYWDLDRPFKCWRDKGGNWHTVGISTCGLVAEGIWRRMGVDLPALYHTYLIGSAIQRARRFAMDCDAWVVPKNKDDMPGQGDYMIIGNGISTHALTVIGIHGQSLVSIDGGQVNETTGLQQIELVVRQWHRSLLGRAKLGSRPVIGWADVTKLRYRGTTALVPAGFGVL